MVKFHNFFFSTIYILGAAGGTPEKKFAPKMAPGASKWANLNLQTIFGAFLCVKTPRFSVGKFWLMIAPPPEPFRVKSLKAKSNILLFVYYICLLYMFIIYLYKMILHTMILL